MLGEDKEEWGLEELRKDKVTDDRNRVLNPTKKVTKMDRVDINVKKINTVGTEHVVGIRLF